MGPPIMTMVQEGLPSGTLLRMNLGTGPFSVIMPDDGRPYEDIMLCEMRPYPAMDAMHMLSSYSGVLIKDMLKQYNEGEPEE